MNGLKELKELIVGCVSNYIGKEKHDMGISGNEGLYAGGGLLGQAVDFQNAMMQSQLAQLDAQQRAQMNMAAAQRQAAMNNAFSGHQQGQELSRALSTFNLNANSLYTFDELNDEGSVYNMPLQTAIDLALNTFGSGWFRDESTVKTLEENTDFWIKVLSKIGKAGRLKCETCRDFNTDTVKTAWKILDTDHGNS
jgi:type II secretory pathway pseudopilin PulG